MQKAVNAEAKTNLKSSTIIWDLNIHCLKSHYPFYNTSSKVQFQGFNNKNFSRSEKSKPKDPKPVPLYDNAAKKLAKKKNKKD